jgi:hypothetical protein
LINSSRNEVKRRDRGGTLDWRERDEGFGGSGEDIVSDK